MNIFRAVRLSFLGVLVAGQLTVSATAAQADDNRFTWQNIVGVTTPIILDTTGAVVVNDVQTIPPGGRPWFTSKGNARFTPETGALRFKVKGLVLIGGGATGTTGAITQVKGTIVCDGPVVLDTEPVPLSPQGDAQFQGHLAPSAACVNPIFLIRIGPGVPGSTTDRWIAAGVVRRPGTGE